MNSVIKSNLGRRIILLVVISTILMLTGLTISGWLAVQQSSSRVLSERKALAQSSASYLDYILKQNLARLDNLPLSTAPDLNSGNIEPEKQSLRNIYQGSIFDYAFLTDELGNLLWVEPYRSDFPNLNIGRYSFVLQSLTDKKPGISNVITITPGGEKVILMVSPIRNNEGTVVGLVGGWIDPTARFLQDVTRFKEPGTTSYTDIIDSDGTILNSSDPSRVLQSDLVANRGKDVVVNTAALSVAPWSVIVGQSQSEATSTVRAMTDQFIIIGLGSMIVALVLAWGTARSLVRPINQLAASVHSISQGDLSQPVPQLGKDEIGELGQSFDSMRQALKKSLEEIQQLNRELEAKVEDRTRKLEESYREIEQKEADRGRLLEKVLSAQEEERKRIARELHDETTQALVGLVMRIEALTAAGASLDPDTRSTLSEVKTLAVRTIDNVHKIIFDLRPSILDDLGLLSAIRWYAENRLVTQGIKVRIEVTGEDRKLSPPVEIALFRIVQEAITNIVKHAEASSAVISVEFTDNGIRIEIEDDGKGFTPSEVNLQPDKIRGVGLLGMRERIMLIGGKFDIISQPGGGTRLMLEVPSDQTEK